MENMYKYIQDFPQQLSKGLEIGKAFRMRRPHTIKHIILAGMGGSGMGGNILQDYLSVNLQVPFIICKDYTLPAYAGKDTLLMISSYSGETVETLDTLRQGIKKKCNIACISSGGTVEKIAVQKHLPHFKIPGGMPPRTCVGYSVVAQLYVLHRAGLISNSFIRDVKDVADFLNLNSKNIRTAARLLAGKIYKNIPLIYTSAAYQSAGLRWKQQLNENPEIHSFHNIIPEMNHNELAAFRDTNRSFAAIFLRSNIDNYEVQRRFQLMTSLIKNKVYQIYQVEAKGVGKLQQLFYFIHFGDWLSYHISVLRNVDAVDITVLNKLKKALSKNQ